MTKLKNLGILLSKTARSASSVIPRAELTSQANPLQKFPKTRTAFPFQTINRSFSSDTDPKLLKNQEGKLEDVINKAITQIPPKVLKTVQEELTAAANQIQKLIKQNTDQLETLNSILKKIKELNEKIKDQPQPLQIEEVKKIIKEVETLNISNAVQSAVKNLAKIIQTADLPQTKLKEAINQFSKDIKTIGDFSEKHNKILEKVLLQYTVETKKEEKEDSKKQNQDTKKPTIDLGTIFKILLVVSGTELVIKEEIQNWRKGNIIGFIKKLAQDVRDYRFSNINEAKSKQNLHEIESKYNLPHDDSFYTPDNELTPEEKLELLKILEDKLPKIPLKIYLGNALSAYYIMNNQPLKAEDIAKKNIKLIEDLLKRKITILDDLSCKPSTLYNELKQLSPAFPTVLAQALYYLGKTSINKPKDKTKKYLNLAVDLRTEIDKGLKTDDSVRDYYNNPIVSDSIVFKRIGTILYDIRRETIKEDIPLKDLESTIKKLSSIQEEGDLYNEEDCKKKQMELHGLIVRKSRRSNKLCSLSYQEINENHLKKMEDLFTDIYKIPKSKTGKTLNFETIKEKLLKSKETRSSKNFNYAAELSLLKGDLDNAEKFYNYVIEKEEAFYKKKKQKNPDYKKSFPLSDAYLGITEVLIEKAKKPSEEQNSLKKAKEFLKNHIEVQDSQKELITKKAERFKKLLKIRPQNSPSDPQVAESSYTGNCR